MKTIYKSLTVTVIVIIIATTLYNLIGFRTYLSWWLSAISFFIVVIGVIMGSKAIHSLLKDFDKWY